MAEKDIGDRAIGRMDARPGGESSGTGVDGLRREVAGIGRDARAAVEGSFSSARDMAADNVHRAAEALHAAAGTMGQGDTVGGLINAAADRLDSASDALRGRDVGQLVRDVNAFARRQPALFIGGALLAGMALGRFATAGTRPDSHIGTGTGMGMGAGMGTSAGAGMAPDYGMTSASYSDSARGTTPTMNPGAASRAAATGAAQEGRLSGAIGGTRGERSVGDPPTTVPGHQAQGARPQPSGGRTGMPTDE
ncbi:hypothetical protein ACM64Y_17015 [Novispirillum sp. DQ9]|uniref:hypothetical protein n=1 Tax=Novispirillum sp. DQ9 TaxID=3398612 RepID=UPI003C79914F